MPSAPPIRRASRRWASCSRGTTFPRRDRSTCCQIVFSCGTRFNDARRLAITESTVTWSTSSGRRRSTTSSPTSYRRDRTVVLRDWDLPPNRQYVLYAVSSAIGLGAGREVEIALRLIDGLRAVFGADAPALVVRPHPKNASGWSEVDDPDIRVVPAGFPDARQQRVDLYNGIAHAVAVVGLDTFSLPGGRDRRRSVRGAALPRR